MQQVLPRWPAKAATGVPARPKSRARTARIELMSEGPHGGREAPCLVHSDGRACPRSLYYCCVQAGDCVVLHGRGRLEDCIFIIG